MRNEHFKIHAVDKHAWNIDLGSLLNLVLDRNYSMSASTQVWLFFALIIISGSTNMNVDIYLEALSDFHKLWEYKTRIVKS